MTPAGSDTNHQLGKEVDMKTDGIEAVFVETHNWRIWSLQAPVEKGPAGEGRHD
jgi:hypothetical protein